MTAVSGQQKPPTLDGPVAKVRRANFHYTEVVEAWDKLARSYYTRPDAYTVEIRDNGCKHVYRAGPHFPSIDPDWGLVLGDAIHNLRSALDHLAWQLVIANGGTPHDGMGGTQFPVVEKPKQIAISGGIDAQALQIIDDVQPYHGTSDGQNLLLLNKLDIMDKHHFAIVTAMVAGNWGRVVDPRFPTIIEKGRPNPTVGVKAGDEAAWFVYATPLNNPDPNLNLLPDVSFVEGPLAGESFLEIGELLRWVQALFRRFARFFPT